MSPPSSLLVVNADDAGLDAERDAAILDAFDRGVVRSASVVVAGATAEAFAAEAKRRPGFSIGLHFNLTDGRAAATTRAFTLTGNSGHFPGDRREVWRRAVEGLLDPREVAREFVAQWRRLEAFGVAPDHVDSREHVHVLPDVSDGVFEGLASVRAKVFVRVPDEGDPAPGMPAVEKPAVPLGTAMLSARRLGQIRAGHGGLASLGVHADVFRRRVVPPLRATSGFLGLALSLAPQVGYLADGLRGAKGPVVEWMAHPGRLPTGGASESAVDPRREQEWRLLVDPATRAAIEAAGYRVGSFADAATAT